MELCPSCLTQMVIGRSYLKIVGDDSPDTPTQVFTCIELKCKNPRCERYNQVIETVEHPQQVG